MSLRLIGRMSLGAGGVCAAFAAVGLVLGIYGDSLVWIYLSIAGSVLMVPFLAVAVVSLVVASQRARERAGR